MDTASTLNLHVLPARPSLAARMQAQLKLAEAAFDSTAALGGELIAKTIQAAEVAGVHRVHIQKHLKQLTARIDHALEGQMELQRFHQGCRGFMKKVDMDVLGFGDTGDTPDPSGSASNAEPVTSAIAG